MRIAEKQEANPSLNAIQPPLGNVPSSEKVHYADGPRIDASVLAFDTNQAKKKAWELNKQLFPRPTKYFDEIETFLHRERVRLEVTLKLESDSSEILAALLSLACFSRHGRTYIVDSGASHPLLSRQALTPEEPRASC